MKKALFRSLSVFLSVVMFLAAVPFSLVPGIMSRAASGLTLGETVEFGSYPQSEVTDSTLISQLDGLDADWRSYGFYAGDNSIGSMQPDSFAGYADVSYNGSRYRGVNFKNYRPILTTLKLSTNASYQKRNGYSIGKIYWFKYEPIKWRVIDPSTGCLLCESLIDCQPFNDTIYTNSSKDDYYSDAGLTKAVGDYSTSSVRAWLNGKFYDTAFSSSEKDRIVLTNSKNYLAADLSGESAQTSSGTMANKRLSDTSDKVTLLSAFDVGRSAYGMASGGVNAGIINTKGTDYAQSLGLFVSNTSGASGYSWWYTRTSNYLTYKETVNGSTIYIKEPYMTLYCCPQSFTDSDDSKIVHYMTFETTGGVRPVIYLSAADTASPSQNNGTSALKPSAGSGIEVNESVSAVFCPDTAAARTVSELTKQLGGGSLAFTDGKGASLTGSDTVGTGARVTAGGKTYDVIVTGDVDGDGVTTSADARMILRCAVGLDDLDSLRLSAGDADHDAAITAADARLELRSAVGLEKIAVSSQGKAVKGGSSASVTTTAAQHTTAPTTAAPTTAAYRITTAATTKAGRTCVRCGGTGTEKCGICHGTGIEYRLTSRWNKDLRHYELVNEPYTCFHCGGLGWTNCQLCGGTGKTYYN